MSGWKIYEPVTEWGKKIASLLRYDDGTRLEIHEYLEKAEPEWIRLKKKLEAVKKLRDELEEYKGFMERASRTRGGILQERRYVVRMELLERLNKILEESE